MSRKFISLIVATSIAVTAIGATQAQAGNRKFERFLAGVATIAIIGAIANNSNNNRSSHEEAAAVPSVGHDRYNHDRYNRGRDRSDRGRQYYRPRDHRSQAAPRSRLPEACMATRYQNGRQRTVYTSKCLNRHYSDADRLPESCAILIPKKHGGRYAQRAYRAHCLKHHGFRAARR